MNSPAAPASAAATTAPDGPPAGRDGGSASDPPTTKVDGPCAVRLRRPSASIRVDVRAVAVCGCLAGLIAGAFAVNLSVGDFPIPLGEVVASILGHGGADSDFIVRTLRLPRSLTAVLVGAAFGLSGAIFQSLARNPLASPDIIGVTAGAAAAAVAAIVLGGVASSAALAAAALAGGLAAALVVYGLAFRKGVTGYRLVLVGIGITAVLSSVTSYLLTRAEIFDAQRATVWLTGSLNGRGWEHVRPVGAALAVLVPATLVLGRAMRALQLGDDAARGLGVPVDRARLGLVVTGVGLAAVATASAGPVAFVALVSPQIARRLVGASPLGLVPAALVGAVVMLLADLVGRRMFAPIELPVGVITAVVGAPYLLWLLARANRVGRGG
ncbi:MAG: iron chelate uptake ABC transporter family permease subunit [Actinobacteria bacterium]|nr:iron chelate uptake ABC transporter family permease subunit [Actinomycetota bacterium]